MEPSIKEQYLSARIITGCLFMHSYARFACERLMQQLNEVDRMLNYDCICCFTLISAWISDMKIAIDLSNALRQLRNTAFVLFDMYESLKKKFVFVFTVTRFCFVLHLYAALKFSLETIRYNKQFDDREMASSRLDNNNYPSLTKANLAKVKQSLLYGVVVRVVKVIIQDELNF